MSLLVTDLAFRRSPPHLERTGLLGFATLAIDERMVVRDVSVRRTRAGRYVISFATRPPRALPLRRAKVQAGAGQGASAISRSDAVPRSGADRRNDLRWRYAMAHPYSAEHHAEIERQVVAQLRERGELP